MKKRVDIEFSPHALEDILGIAPNTTAVARTTYATEPVEHPEYDEKDKEIEHQFDEIYAKAMGAFDDLMADMIDIDPKYKARNTEVSVQLLNAAISAIRGKSSGKQNKDNIKGRRDAKSKNPQTNVVFASFGDLVSLIDKEKFINEKEVEAISVETIETTKLKRTKKAPIKKVGVKKIE